jgi:hypothetical protein
MSCITGRIYGIYDSKEKCIYVGSTRGGLSQRLWNHKTDSKNCSHRPVYRYINENGGWEQFKMLLIEDVSCESYKMLQRREGEFIIKLQPPCNQRVAGRTKTEYRQLENIREKNRIYMREYMRQYNKKKREQKELTVQSSANEI